MLVRLGLAQINPVVGDLPGNRDKILAYVERAFERGVQILSFPELSLVGYPPEDLLLKPKFIEDNLKVLTDIAKRIKEIVTILGFVEREDERIYNAAAIIYGGKVCGVYRKSILPNYGVFDEKRYFKSGGEPLVFSYGSLTFGVNICEDIWFREGPTKLQVFASSSLILNISASPYHVGKIKLREEMLKERAKEYGVTIAYTNMVGGQDELVFDGGSMVVSASGEILAKARQFEEQLLLVDIELEVRRIENQKAKYWKGKRIEIAERIRRSDKLVPVDRFISYELSEEEEIWEALLLGLRDYARKNGFHKVVIGLSGGIDSSLVATLACDALGKENVKGVFMPSRYTSSESREDVYHLCRNLGIEPLEIPIEPIFSSYKESLKNIFENLDEDVTEENIQARIRGNILMALSNKFGWLVLTTGNKSEMSVGYATLYGDMAGGFAVIKDVPKTTVYKLAHYRNSKGRVIPERVLKKEPSAELKPDQKDTDTLPPYGILDPILKLYIEEDKELEDIVLCGIQKDTVEKVLNMVDRAEYKRRQAPLGIKITPKAFGKDRRMPVTNRYRHIHLDPFLIQGGKDGTKSKNS
ncbi:MAG: NAD+ synthase [Desulfobacterota bacterium]|nr:NAD+ synthase [Thermodesulfobacteriota bacterium]MDW8002479.1 NAD+ synthase [Deltaproteobacteria bacterium]